MKTNFYNLSLALLVCLFLSALVIAQEGTIRVYGYSGLTFDQVNNSARGTSYTELDYQTQAYYTPYVCGSIYADGLELVRTCGGGIHRATRVNSTNVGNANTVMVLSDHYVDLKYQEDPYTSYADYYGYGFLLNTANPIFSYFFPPLIYNSLNESSKNLGSTDVSIQRNTCGDVRDQIVLEYRNATYGPPAAIPSCNFFVNSIDNTDFPHFTFNELNTGDHGWALMGQAGRSLPLGSEGVRANNGNVALHVESGYRCPQRNYNIVPRGATNSQHIYGFGADIQTVNNWNAAAWENLRAAALGTYEGCCEPLIQSGYGHVHVDWRQWNPLYNPGCPASWRQ